MDPQKLQQLREEPTHFTPEEESHHLKIVDLFRLSLRIFRVRPLRTFLTVMGISLGIGTVLFLVSLGFGLQYIMLGKLASTEDSLISLEAFYPSESGLDINQQTISDIIVLPETEEISPIAEFPGEIKSDSNAGFLLVKIVKPNYFRLSGLKPDIGYSFTENEYKSAVISNTALKLFNLKEDNNSLQKSFSAKIFYQSENEAETKISSTNATVAIKGIITDEFQPPFIIIPAESLSEKPPFYQRIFVKTKDINQVERLRDELINKGFLISARIDLINQSKKILTAITTVLGIFGVAALVVSAIGMFNTMIISFLERVFEVGIMKSIGATSADIRNLFLMESLIMGLAGGLGGILAGIGAGELSNLGLNFLASRLGGKPVVLFIYPVQFIIFIIILSGLVGILSGFWPARKASQLSPRQAFQQK